MTITKQEQIAFIEKFAQLCQANDIGYSIDLNTLLNSYQANGKSDSFEVMMNFLSYQRLKRLVPSNVVDSFIDQKFPTLTAAFVKDNQNWKKPGPFIQIRLVVPTTIKKIKRFNNRGLFLGQKIRRIDSNIKNALNFLYESKHEGFIGLDKRFKKIDYNGAPNIDFTTVFLPFAHFKVAVLKNGQSVLETGLGQKGQSKESIMFKKTYLSPLKKINNNFKDNYES